MWVPLSQGKQVIIAPSRELDIAVLNRLLKEEKVTCLFPHQQLLQRSRPGGPGCFSAVCELWVGGDVVSADAVQRVRDRCPNTLISNGYGPTETTTFATHHAISGFEKVTGQYSHW